MTDLSKYQNLFLLQFFVRAYNSLSHNVINTSLHHLPQKHVSGEGCQWGDSTPTLVMKNLMSQIANGSTAHGRKYPGREHYF